MAEPYGKSLFRYADMIVMLVGIVGYDLFRVFFFFFFFQAEDGIRDGRVTGVQTCALPISYSWSHIVDDLSRRLGRTCTNPHVELLEVVDDVRPGIRVERASTPRAAHRSQDRKSVV